ncbi:(2Fe-2S)-binding protein [Pseudonocardia acaciae]|uniref:(2Fe-2S)-binding protein n=1 Tax=Pseudonocardia acaciae TaxID=551276 RepID=UPI001FE1CEF2|nr:(2Fe-2S)-binding protein [Pseudonocardia acaciae]
MCTAVTEREVRACVRAGARTVDEVGERSLAGTGCGGCHEHIEMILMDAEALDAPGLHALPQSA